MVDCKDVSKHSYHYKCWGYSWMGGHDCFSMLCWQYENVGTLVDWNSFKSKKAVAERIRKVTKNEGWKKD